MVETVRASGAASVVKLAFEFLVLTAARSGEVRGVAWAEIHTEDHVWTVPATRTKAKREHRVLPSSMIAFFWTSADHKMLWCRRRRQTNSVRVCSPTPKRVASLRPRWRGALRP